MSKSISPPTSSHSEDEYGSSHKSIPRRHHRKRTYREYPKYTERKKRRKIPSYHIDVVTHGGISTPLSWYITPPGSIEPPRPHLGDRQASYSNVSYNLKRDEFDTIHKEKALFPHNRGNESDIILSERTYRISQSAVRDLYRSFEHNSVYNFIKDKLWSSLCPDGIDLSFGTPEGQIRPVPWFATNVINGPWREAAKMAFISMLTVGYAVVAYGPKADLDMEIAPRIIDPLECHLEWKVDQNGMRYYTPRPISSKLPVKEETNFMFENADVFIVNEPSHNGDINSCARACHKELIFLQQILDDYQILDHGRANVPLIIQSNTDKNIPAWLLYGHGRGIPDTTALPPFLQGGSGHVNDGRGAAVGAYGGTSQISRPAERALGLNLYAYGNLVGGRMKATKEAVVDTYIESASKARVTALRTVDNLTGHIDEVSPDLMWQRSMIPLPAGSFLGDFHIPEPPRDFSKVMTQTISLICASMGVPPELILGVAGSGSKVTTATLSQEQLRATVFEWRGILSRMLTKIYWRIYGEFHLKNLAAATARAGITLNINEAIQQVRDLAVEFVFRNNKLDYPHAKEMFQDGILRGKALLKVAMDEYGLSPDDVQIPLTDIEKSRFSKQSNYQDNGEIGDIGLNDAGSLGFSNYTREPTTNRSLRL